MLNLNEFPKIIRDTLKTGKSRNIKDYLLYPRFNLVMLVAWIICAIRENDSIQNPIIVMQGHLLDGNLKAFFEYTLTVCDLPYELYYITLSKSVYDKLTSDYDSGILLGTRLKDMKKVVRASCIITSHGPMTLYALHLLNPEIHFVDFWHGIAFKDYRPEEFKQMHFYSKCFVSSESYGKTYQTYRGFRKDQIVASGMAKHDQFLLADDIAPQVREELGITGFKYIILYAPTWWGGGHGNINSEIPFAMEENEFFNRINGLCEKLDAVMIFRLHQNSTVQFNLDRLTHIMSVPQTVYPDTNRLLNAVDLLITDWSSIAADYSALDRPILYLNTPKPVDYHLSPLPLPMERGGIHVDSIEDFEEKIKINLRPNRPSIAESQKKMKNFVFGNMLDGNACKRIDAELRRLIDDK